MQHQYYEIDACMRWKYVNLTALLYWNAGARLAQFRSILAALIMLSDTAFVHFFAVFAL